MSTIETAAAATTDIDRHASMALDVLRAGFEGRTLNGHGIYVDPSSRRRDLLEARKAIDIALSLMAATKWPTNTEYEQAENA